MAGAILERELTTAQASRVRFDIAARSDDAEIRRLLRENPMGGRISITLEREPDYFAERLSNETKVTIVGRERDRLVGLGACTVRQRFVNGEPLRVGYLSGLRLDAQHAGRFDIVRRGYELFRTLQAESPADFYFTSIAADNERARRFLERGISGMPRYDFIAEFVTVIVATSGDSSPRLRAKNICARAIRPDEFASFLSEHNRGRQFAPCWTMDEMTTLVSLGLRTSDFRILKNGDQIVTCAALWDQRSFKQTVIRGYSQALMAARPVFNFFARITNRPQLPRVGEALSSAFVSHLAGREGDTEELIEVVSELRRVAGKRGIQLLTLGFAANDLRLAPVLNNFRCRQYRSRLYVVRWPGIGGGAAELDGRFVAPEVALL